MRGSFMKRLLCVILVIAMVATYAVPAYAAEDDAYSFAQVDNDRVSASLFDRESAELPDEEVPYADYDVVRVSIVLEKAGTIEAGYSTLNIAENSAAMNYRNQIERDQTNIVSKIENAIGEELDVVWNLTLAANIISANIAYGDIDAVLEVDGVKGVIIETRYEPDVVSTGAADPNMATSGKQIGSSAAWLAGYTGAGSKIAIIDTGADIEHEAFNSDAFEYSLSLLDGEYDLMDASDIAAVLTELNAYGRVKVSADDLYVNAKIPFGFNYVDRDLDIIHVNDGQGEHGSHVAGIATANAYVKNADGTFSSALTTTFVQGVAPDAQLIVMKVFGKDGGAYDSDYMAAIEDAIILGADSVNLSLGAGNPGFSRTSGSSVELGSYQTIMDNLTKSGVVVAMSAGNSSYWAENAESGLPYLYLDDVSFQTDGSPGSYTNAFTTASVENDGYVAAYFLVDNTIVSYTDNQNGYGNAPMTTLGGTQEYVLVNAIGELADFEAVGKDVLEGKIVMCYRGTTSFFEKANAAVSMGAIGVVVVNNQAGIINMDLTDYTYDAPVVSILQTAGEYFKAAGTENTTESGITYWTGSMEVASSKEAFQYNSDYYTMSSFSSWGVPGSLELKPEITAPGGQIYSVAGANVTQGTLLYSNHTSYELMSGTSMASPQVAGMAALMAQYIRESGLEEQTGKDARFLAQSLLMSTAVPLRDAESEGNYYPVIQQGAGLANVGNAVSADSYIMMGANATDSYRDGKIKAELGDDPEKTGVYSLSFTINNLTNKEKSFALSADVFTQDYFTYSGIALLDTWTANLTPDIAWTVNGKAVSTGEELVGLDFNGDGVVNTEDGQILLDYATGLEVTLSNADKADLDDDNDIDSYDAYLFFDMLNAGGAIVPANGSAEVTVTITLRDADKAFLANYENGAYIEAYVYAESLSSAEGVEGTTHSIPVLAFYGNWSDASMFDKGSYVEFEYGLETRPPYLYSSAYKKGSYNGLTIKYSDMDGEYWFGGNPMVTDETYMPERNAFSTARGDMLGKVGFTAIRNAATSAFMIVDAETGEYYELAEVGQIPSAFYHVSGGTWRNTYYTISLGVTPDIPEDTAVDVGLILIPEYYIDSEGNVDLTALGEGATFSMPMVIDNTAPTVDTVNVDVENSIMTVTATDNQYIAAVALYDANGQTVFAYAGADADQAAGDTVEYALDLSNVNGSSFLLQVYDYAMNTATYEIKTQIGEVTDTVDSIEVSPSALMMAKGATKQLTATVSPVNASNRNVIWTSSDETIATVDENGVVTAVAAGDVVITATAEADETISATCSITVIELDSTLYGVLQDEEGTPMLFSWNLATDSTWTAGVEIEPYIENVAYDAYRNAMFIQDSASQKMYQIDPTTGETIGVSASAAAFGAPCFDMAASYLFGDTETTYLFGVYGGYFLGPVVNLENTFNKGWNLASYLANYTGADRFVAVCEYGYNYDASTDTYADVYLALDNTGTLWRFTYDRSGSLGLGMMRTNLNLPYTMYNVSQYCSLVSDANGDLYLSHFTGKTNEIYYLTFSASSSMFEALYVGNVGDDIWPAALYMAEVNEESDSDSFDATAVQVADACQMVATNLETEDIEIVVETEANGSLNAAISTGTAPARPMSDVDLSEGKDTVTVTVTVKDITGASVASTNGVASVTYDESALLLTSVYINGDYYAVDIDDGVVTFGYVDLEGIEADAVVATLVFIPITDEDTTVTVTTKEANADKSGYEEELVVELACRHNYEAEVTDPTCTEEGYTTYTCSICGDTYVDDYVDALGHDYEAEVTDPTCTEEGYTTYTCSICGDTYVDDYVDATGHEYEDGHCKHCGEEDPDYEEPTEPTEPEPTEPEPTEPEPTEPEPTEPEPTEPEPTEPEPTEPEPTEPEPTEPEPTEPQKPGKPSWWDWWDKFFGGGNKCNHNYTSNVVHPSCECKGYTEYTCTKCGNSYKDSYTDALGHDWDDGEVTKEATCTENGVKTYTCETCSKTKTETIKAIGHDYHNGVCGNCGKEESTKPGKPGWGSIWDWFFGGWWK